MLRAASLPRRSAHTAWILWLLAVVAAAGAAVGLYRLAVGLGASTNLSDAYPWGLWIGFDFALIAVSGGAFTLAAIVYVLGWERYRPLLRPVLVTGWIGYVAVQVILLLDLGRPDRFWGFLVHPNIHSPLYEVSWCVFLYTGVLTLEVLPAFVPEGRVRRLLGWLRRVNVPLVIAGITLSTLHQSTLGTIFLAMPERVDPLWFTPLLPVLFLVSAVGTGLATGMLVSLGSARLFRAPVPRRALAGLARASLAVWALYLLLEGAHLVGSDVLLRALRADAPAAWFLLEVGLLAVLPLLLFARRRARIGGRGLVTPALFVIAGVVLNRFNLTLTAQRAPAGGYAPHWMEIATQVGVLAAAAWVWYVALRALATRRTEAGNTGATGRAP